MGKYTTVSAKIPPELKEKLRELDINISSFVRDALREEVRRREEERLRRLGEEVQGYLRKIPVQEINEIIRETREER